MKKLITLLCFIYLLAPAPCRAQTTVSAVFSITNAAGTDPTNSFTLVGAKFLWTNSTTSSRYIAPTNNPNNAATNLFNRLSLLLANQYLVSYSAPTNIRIQTLVGQSTTALLASTISPGWGTLTFTTNTAGGASVGASNIHASSITLGATTITDFNQVGDLSAITNQGQIYYPHLYGDPFTPIDLMGSSFFRAIDGTYYWTIDNTLSLNGAGTLINFAGKTLINANISGYTTTAALETNGTVTLKRANGSVTNFFASNPMATGIAMTNAQRLASSGDTIFVYADAVVTAPLGKDGVDWWFAPVTVTTTNIITSTNGPNLWDDRGTAMTFNISGYANFWITNGEIFHLRGSLSAPSGLNVSGRSAVVFGSDTYPFSGDALQLDENGQGGNYTFNFSELLQSHIENAINQAGLANITVTCPTILGSHDMFNNSFDVGATNRIKASVLGSTFDGTVLDCANEVDFVTADFAFSPHSLILNNSPLSVIHIYSASCADTGTNVFEGNRATGLNTATGVIFPQLASRPSFLSIGSITNRVFMWQSNGLPPTVRGEYYDTHTNAVMKWTQ